MLDSDLAKLYEVETKILNRAVHRNIQRFPNDFMFQLTPIETTALRFQFGTSKSRGGRRYRPYVKCFRAMQIWPEDSKNWKRNTTSSSKLFLKL